MPKFGEPIPNWTAPAWPDETPLEGRFVRLERLDPARHAAELHRANSADDSIWDYMPYGSFADAAAYRAWADAQAAERDPWFLTIIDKTTGLPAGVASYLRITPTQGVIEVGHICLSPALQRTPAATEAMFLMMDWAFGAGYRRYEWKCDSLNLPSRRAAQRYGFSYEGTFRQHVIYKGRNRDTAWFAIIDRDWPELRKAYQTWLAPGNFEGNQQIRRLSELTAPLLVARDPALA